MKKDNEKTFADLFNSSNDDKEFNSSNASFDDILKKSEDEDGNSLKEDDDSDVKADSLDNDVGFGDLVIDGTSLEDKENDKDASIDMKQDVLDEDKKESLDDNVFSNFSFVSNDIDSNEKDNLSLDIDNNTLDDNKDESLDNNNFSFFDNEVDSDAKEVDNSLDIVNDNNLFFNEDNKENSVEKSDAEDSNLFFQNQDDGSSNSLGVNNFFGNDDSVQDVSNLIEKSEPQESILNQSVVSSVESDEKGSESPFFSVDEKKDTVEENPLFLNTLNLIENENQERKSTMIDSTKSRHFNVKIVKKKEPLFKVIIGVISYAIFIWLLLIGIALLIYVLDIKIRASKGDYSSPTYNAYVVLTGSMLPEIQVYDVVLTKKVKPDDLKVGDVITFASADTRFLGTIITHRIKQKEYNAETKTYNFQTKGDNNNVVDSAWVPANNIYGKVILKIPKLGYLQEFLAADGGWIIVILIPCLAVISYDIVKLAKGLKRKKYKNIKVQK